MPGIDESKPFMSERNVAMVDLKATYQAQAPELDAAVKRVLESG